MESSVNRKIKELKQFGEAADAEGRVIKSPFYNDVENNPCIKEQNLSARCAIEYNAEICKDYTENFVLCVKFWEMVKMRRRLNSEYPALPLPEDRDVVKKYYHDELIRLGRKAMPRHSSEKIHPK